MQWGIACCYASNNVSIQTISSPKMAEIIAIPGHNFAQKESISTQNER